MTDSIDKTPRMWRVVLGDGDVRGVAVRRETATAWYAWTPHSDAKCRASTERFAVTRYVARLGWETAEILAPGEPSRAELAARATAAEARVAELLSDRADAAEVLVTEVERAQTAERRAAELTAALREYAPTCACGRIATWVARDRDPWGYDPPSRLCDEHQERRARRDQMAHAAVLRALDGVSR